MNRLCTFLTLALALAANAITINSFGVNGYVISADFVDGNALTNRHAIDTIANIDFGSPPPGDNFTVQFDLLDASNVVVATGTTTVGTAVSGVKNVSGSLTPSSTLTPRALYRVKVTVLQNAVDVSNSTEATGNTFVHLTGTNEATSALNALSQVNAIVINRTWLLETDATRYSITLDITGAHACMS